MRFARSRSNPPARPAILLTVALLSAPAVAQGEAEEVPEALLSGFERIEQWSHLLKGEATYEEVSEDSLVLGAEVLSNGFVLDGFVLRQTAIEPGRGVVQFEVEYVPDAQSDPWGLSPATAQSDQLRLFLVSELDPEARFGELTVDLIKEWRRADESLEWPLPEEEAPAGVEGEEASEEVIALADEETTETEPTQGDVESGSSAAATQLARVPAGQKRLPRPQSQRIPATATLLKPAQSASEYSFYEHAAQARWHSSAGALDFPSGAANQAGSVRAIDSAPFSTGNQAVKLLLTQPEPRRGGWVQGFYPEMTLGPDLHFKAVAGFLEGSPASDGVLFELWAYQGKQGERLASRHVTPREYVDLDVDLSDWAGRKVALLLKVLAGNSGEDDWAAWVSPRLVREP